MQNRKYEILLYGASGFTGRQTVKYFADHAAQNGVRWAIAGRNLEKLEQVKCEIGGAAQDIDVLAADIRDQASIDGIVAQTQVLLSTAGPFALYGSPIVDACVRLKTHYVDITGETTWVKDLIDLHHRQAAEDGTRIIPFCGFDSVPSDLGAYLVARRIQTEFGLPCREVMAYFQVDGGVNGGTLATVFNLQETGQALRARDVFLLNPEGERSPEDIRQNQDPKKSRYEPAIGAWCGPFFMGQINTRVVRRSSALFEQWGIPYGPGFRYQEFMKFDQPMGRVKALGMTTGLGLFQSAVQSPFRHLLKRLLPKPGAGPSENAMNNGWFRCDLVGVAANGRGVSGLIRDRGDPGNRATVKFLCESALSLVLNAEELPGGAQRGGVLTPATGLGDILARRLSDAGMTIECKVQSAKCLVQSAECKVQSA